MDGFYPLFHLFEFLVNPSLKCFTREANLEFMRVGVNLRVAVKELAQQCATGALNF
jgi:hypothetical protein